MSVYGKCDEMEEKPLYIALLASPIDWSGGSDAVSAPTVTQVSNIRLSLLDTYA